MLYVLTNFTDFLVSAWIWNLTFAFSYIIMLGICMMILIRLMARESLLRALFLSIAAQVVSIIFFSGLVVGLIINFLNWQYNPEEVSAVLTNIDVLRASLSLGIVYAIIQSIFFWLIESHLNSGVVTYIIIAWLSNGMASLISCWLINWAMKVSL